jgi:hypothetical protein
MQDDLKILNYIRKDTPHTKKYHIHSFLELGCRHIFIELLYI